MKDRFSYGIAGTCLAVMLLWAVLSVWASGPGSAPSPAPAADVSSQDKAPNAEGRVQTVLAMSGPLIPRSFYPKSCLARTRADVIFYDLRNVPTFQLVCSTKAIDDPPEHLTALFVFQGKSAHTVHRVEQTIDVRKQQEQSDKIQGRFRLQYVPQFNVTLTKDVAEKATAWTIRLHEH